MKPPQPHQGRPSLNESGARVNAGADPHATRELPARLPLVAIIGRANVGKSTLFNRLVRERRALVEDRPGVTRDRLIAATRIEGHAVLLADTGGLDPDAEEGIPAAVAAQARRAIQDARVILFVLDARSGLLPQDRDIAELLRRAERQVVVVANKVDGLAQLAALGEFHALGFRTVLPVSAEHKLGVADLEIAIAARLGAEPPAGEGEPAEAEGLRIAIVGRPNVGKSSLVNRLAGEAHAIVSELPGTTRDATDLRIRFAGEEVVLIDTAGLRRQGRRDDPIERGSALMALRSIERCDAAILLLDSTEGVTDQDCKIARLARDRGRPVVVALNKWDLFDRAERAAELERALDRKLRFLREPVIVRVSARTGLGTDEVLRQALAIARASQREISTAVINRALEQSVARNPPPLRGRRRARLYYATQVGRRPITLLVFANDPSLISDNYHRYLESSLREGLELGAAPLRLRFRARRSESEDEQTGRRRESRR